ncbi:hypothetical protein [Nocardia salmonicida]|uniref:hypothetical protein n=1 Tax=Nocardia salmonicida TaxID=53431 RepID=UPI0037928E7E
MKFYLVYLECPSETGEVEWDESFDPPRPISAHLLYDAPPISDLVTSRAGVHMVTVPLADALAATDLTGFEFAPSTSEAVPDVEMRGEYEIPPMRVLVITGRPFVDDFGPKQTGIILSQRGVDFLTAWEPRFSRFVMDVL